MAATAPPMRALREAVTAQWGLVAAAVTALTDEQMAKPSRLPGWRVAELVAHLAGNTDWLIRCSEAAPEAESGTGQDVQTYYDRAAAGAAAVSARATKRATETSPAELRQLVADSTARAIERLAELPDATVMGKISPPIALREFLIGRALEGVVHGHDLAVSTGVPLDHDRAALGVVTRFFTDRLSRAQPGHSVEVRVPPFAAVQCIDGPRHTRGTPGAVVETDPLTWMDLAAGRVAWSAALASGRVQASGARADLSSVLPLLH